MGYPLLRLMDWGHKCCCCSHLYVRVCYGMLRDCRLPLALLGVTQRRLVVNCRRFGITYRSHLQVSSIPRKIFMDYLTLEDGTGIFLIKPTTCTNFPHLFLSRNSTCFGQFLCPSSGFHSLYIRHWYSVCHARLMTYTSAECTRNKLLMMGRGTARNM